MCTVLATDSRICCYWLRPLLLGKGSLDQILFFSLGLMCKALWVRIKRLVSGQMAGLTVRKEPGSSRGATEVERNSGITIKKPRAQ